MAYSQWYAVKAGTYQDADTMVHDLTIFVNGRNAADARDFLVPQLLQYDGREIYVEDLFLPCAPQCVDSETSPYVLVCDRNLERNFLPQVPPKNRPDYGLDLAWSEENGLVVARAHRAGIRATSVFGWDDVARLAKAFGLKSKNKTT